MITFLVALTLLGCPSSEDDTGAKKNRPSLTDTDTTDTYTPPPPWTPLSGSYAVTAETEVKNTCGQLSEENGKPSPALQVEVNGDATAFTLIGDDPVDTGTATTTTTCPMSQVLDPEIHYPFDCDALVASLNLSEFSMRGTITFSVDVVGTWTSETHFDATNTGTVTCKGPDCGTVSDYLDVPFPCEVISTTATDKLPE